jgi:hypothetical protein
MSKSIFKKTYIFPDDIVIHILGFIKQDGPMKLLYDFKQKKFIDYFRPIMKTLGKYYSVDINNSHHITKQFLISTLFSDYSTKRRQKILKKAKQLNIWNIENNIFEPVTYDFSTCNKDCTHYFSEAEHTYECYDNYRIYFKREFLKLKLQNISDKIKDVKYKFYWINISVLKSLYNLFIILISPPHSTIGFIDKTPIYLLPSQYFTVKSEENEVKVYEKEEEMEEVQESVVVEET